MTTDYSEGGRPFPEGTYIKYEIVQEMNSSSRGFLAMTTVSNESPHGHTIYRDAKIAVSKSEQGSTQVSFTTEFTGKEFNTLEGVISPELSKGGAIIMKLKTGSGIQRVDLGVECKNTN